jgi:sulfide:quinone oxidoreductase
MWRSAAGRTLGKSEEVVAVSASGTKGIHRVVIAGGGVAALEGALALRKLADRRVAIELLAPEPQFWYRPLSVVEAFEPHRVHGLELSALAEAIGATFTLGSLECVDADRHAARSDAGALLTYDYLLVATGARPVVAVEGALTFRGPADSDRVRRLLDEMESGIVRRLAFAVPAGTTWALPLYELALMTAKFLGKQGLTDVELALVTPEDTPLGVFGANASAAIVALLSQRRVRLHTGVHPVAAEPGLLHVTPGDAIPADRVIALPRLEGPRLAGLPHDWQGFIPIDPDARVRGLDDVFAAGDVTAFPVKQGGLAAQQAEAAAATIAAAIGADVRPRPFRPVLRGLVLTGESAHYLRAELAGGTGDTSLAASEPLWWPPGKIAGTHLGPFLAEWADTVLSPRRR